MDTTQYTKEEVAAGSVVRNEQVELDKRAMNVLLHKINLRLMPLLLVLFFLSFLDLLNIGNEIISVKIVYISFLQRAWSSF